DLHILRSNSVKQTAVGHEFTLGAMKRARSVHFACDCYDSERPIVTVIVRRLRQIAHSSLSSVLRSICKTDSAAATCGSFVHDSKFRTPMSELGQERRIRTFATLLACPLCL